MELGILKFRKEEVLVLSGFFFYIYKYIYLIILRCSNVPVNLGVYTLAGFSFCTGWAKVLLSVSWKVSPTLPQNAGTLEQML
jgi:hypothetical protein